MIFYECVNVSTYLGYGSMAGMYLQAQLRLPEFFPIGQWNRFKWTEVRHVTDPSALKLVRNGTKVSIMGFVMGAVLLLSLIT